MYRFLLVDDQQDMHRLVEHHLSKQLEEPFELEVASDAVEALKRVSGSADYDIVLLDLCLPDFIGLDLLEKSLELRPKFAVIVVSGRGSEQTVVEALERGAMSYVDKPSLATTLVPTVRKVLAASRAGALRERINSGMTAARFAYELENDPGLIPAILDEVREVFTRFGVGSPNAAQLLIGVEEALANALYHGNLEIGSELKHTDFNAFYQRAQEACARPEFCDRRVRLHLEVRAGNAWVTVSDDGNGFDPAAVPDPTLPENADKAYGRGLLLMRAFFDEVVYNERGNEVTLVVSAVPEGQYVAPDVGDGDWQAKGEQDAA